MKKYQKSKALTQTQLQSSLLKTFIQDPKKRYSAKQLKNKLKLENSIDSVQSAMNILEEQGAIYMPKTDKYRLDRSYNISKSKSSSRRSFGESSGKKYIGKVDLIASGAAYIMIPELEDDVYVPSRDTNGALHGDKVKIEITHEKRRKSEGRVLEVLERANRKFVGIYKSYKNESIVLVQHPKMQLEIIVDAKSAKDGDNVVVRIDQYSKSQNKKYRGEIIEVLPQEDNNEMTMQSILINNGFDIQFTQTVMNEANALEMNTEAELDKRLDLRNVPSFTIDPDDAKDFDDALSVEFLENNHVRVGIHIADVTHYVRPNTELDEEAFTRSTSVYLVDRVCPMLPEKISNELCSLRPNEDKFTFSVLVTYDENQKIVDEWIGKTIIHSKRRFTYSEAQEVIETGKGDLEKELTFLNDYAKESRKYRLKNGSINFDSPEIRFELDDNKKPIRAYQKIRKEAHLLVEEYMLLANRLVATFISKKGKSKEIPFVYRVHDLPNPEKVKDLALFAAEFGVKLNVDTPENIATAFNQLSEAAKENDLLKILEPMAIRSMSKAIYTTDNIGHYGLGFEFYSHFTSPIRRYSDVLTHRILEKNLEEKPFYVDKSKLEIKCGHISGQERKAMTAERESMKYKQVEFMVDHVGEEFEGQINGIIDKGIFVELADSHAEGLIRFDSFDEPFHIPESRLKALGKKSGRVIKMGDKVKVLITAADLDSRTIDMEWVD